MDVDTAGKKIEALESEVAALKSELRKLAKSIDRVVDEANGALAKLRARIEALETKA